MSIKQTCVRITLIFECIDFIKLADGASYSNPCYQLNGLYTQLRSIILYVEDEQESRKLKRLQEVVDSFYDGKPKAIKSHTSSY